MHDPQGSAVDWWGLGVLTYELLLGRTPFAGENGKTRLTYLNIMHKEASFPEPGEREEGDISGVCRDFVLALLSKDPRGRAGSASSVRKHPFFSRVRWDSLLLEEPPLRVGPSGGRRSSPSSGRGGGAPVPAEDEVECEFSVDNASGWWWDPEDAIAAAEQEEEEEQPNGEAAANGEQRGNSARNIGGARGGKESDWWPFDRFNWSDGDRDLDTACAAGHVRGSLAR